MVAMTLSPFIRNIAFGRLCSSLVSKKPYPLPNAQPICVAVVIGTRLPVETCRHSHVTTPALFTSRSEACPKAVPIVPYATAKFVACQVAGGKIESQPPGLRHQGRHSAASQPNSQPAVMCVTARSYSHVQQSYRSSSKHLAGAADNCTAATSATQPAVLEPARARMLGMPQQYKEEPAAGQQKRRMLPAPFLMLTLHAAPAAAAAAAVAAASPAAGVTTALAHRRTIAPPQHLNQGAGAT